MGALLDNLADWVSEKEWALQKMRGDEYTARNLDEMVKSIALAIDSVDFGDDLVKRRGITLLCLGPVPYSNTTVGAVEVGRAVYIGADAKIYIEGPRRRHGNTIIDIHPYCVEDAQGWGGVSASRVMDMTASCFI